MPVILRNDHIEKIQNWLKESNDNRTFDYKECVFMSLSTFVELNELFETYTNIRELNTTEVRKITRDYYYDDGDYNE